jgi:hypothetical protein
VNCLDKLEEARKRRERLETSGRSSHDDVAKVTESIEELNRTIWDMIECLTPALVVGMALPPIKKELDDPSMLDKIRTILPVVKREVKYVYEVKLKPLVIKIGRLLGL